MAPLRPPLLRTLGVYALVSAAIFGVTRFEAMPTVGPYVHLVVAAIFLLSAITLTRDDPTHYGLALGGLLEPDRQDRYAGPLGLVDLARALYRATPSALVELAAAVGIAMVVFPLYAVGYWWWQEPSGDFSLRFPPDLASFVLAQIVVVALPEEAFFRGYLQTALRGWDQRRWRLFGVELAPGAWILQAALFALLHFVVEAHPARLAVFFPALLFGWARAWRGGIGAALALHAMSNLYSEILRRSWL
ncbi:MAG TPA: MrtC family glutamic-type intramembrane protease [Polyangiales bacterium]|nr:MrtC family glutamic-type intramembrane protease [Polyangiales bacterium]